MTQRDCTVMLVEVFFQYPTPHGGLRPDLAIYRSNIKLLNSDTTSSNVCPSALRGRVSHVSLTIDEERLSVLLPTCINLFNCGTSCLQTLTDNRPRVPCVTDDWRGETIRAIAHLCKSLQLLHILSADPD
ncbi:hypothetical protein J6590_030592 [Homalodisca vitripennis]|nr:hypothetical protein J6590_030592 [Homalodisca vitripennis]